MNINKNYTCKVVKPEDFDLFWGDVLDDLSQVDLKPEIIHDDLRSTKDIDIYQVFFNSLNNIRISAWLATPVSKMSDKPIPVILQLPGYQNDPLIPKYWPLNGYASLSLNHRGKVRSRSEFDPGYPGVLTHNITDRNSYSYKGIYSDVWASIDLLSSNYFDLSNINIDSNRIGVAGSSQGGGLTIISAAMKKEVKAAACGAPYLCGYMDAVELTNTYPYQEINDYLNLYPDRLDDVTNTLSYFDGMNFADKITCPIILNVGLQDNVCPPETAYAIFEKITSKNKKIYEYDGYGHDAGRYLHDQVTLDFFENHLGK